MNNIKTLTIVAIFMAATLVVGTLAATSTIARTQTAFAFSKNKKGDENSKNGNTITALKCQNKGSASGFDTATNQECENLICTHPGNNTTCVQEGAAAAPQTPVTPVKLTCEQCFMKFLTTAQITILLGAGKVNSLEQLCAPGELISDENVLVGFLVGELGLSESAAAQLIQCLKDAGVQFSTDTGPIITR